MKIRSVVYRKIVCALLLLALMVLGCEMDQSFIRQYSAERKFDRCFRNYQKVMINPAIASTEHFVATATKFREFLASFESNADSSLAIAELCKRSYFYLAKLSGMQGDHRKAVSWYERSLRKFPHDNKHQIQTHLALAHVHQQLLELQLAAQSYREVVSKENFKDLLQTNLQLISIPLTIARLNHLSGMNGKGNSEYNQAVAYYTNLVSENPDSELGFWAQVQLANSYADQGDWNHCLKLLENAVQINPTNSEIYKVLLFIAEIQSEVRGNFWRSKYYYEKVIEESDDPDILAKGHFGLASLLFKQKKNDEARTSMLEILDQFPRQGQVGAKVLLAIARSYEQEQKWDRALVQYRWLMDTYPLTSAGLYAPLHIANHFKLIGEQDLAETAYMEATQRYFGLINKYPLSRVAAIAQEYLTICYTLNEEWDTALNSARQLYDNYKTVPQVMMSSLIMLGQLYEKNNEHDAALEIYEDFLRKFAGHPLASHVENRVKILKMGG